MIDLELRLLHAHTCLLYAHFFKALIYIIQYTLLALIWSALISALEATAPIMRAAWIKGNHFSYLD